MLGNTEPRDLTGHASKPSLLYVTPVAPMLTGNGLAMRAGMVLEALSASHRVSVLVVPLYGSPEAGMPNALRSLCERSTIVTARGDVQSRIQQAGLVYRDSVFDFVHVFRLSAMPWARPYMIDGPGRARRHLDLDDVDSKTHKRIAALSRENGEEARAARETAEAQRCELLEVMAFRLFDRIYVCSEQDRQSLLIRSKAEIYVLPNAVRAPSSTTPPSTDPVFRLLFVGTLSYYPNEDAVLYFCTRILPAIRKSAPLPVAVDIVGGGASDAVRAAAVDTGATLAGQVPQVGTYYERAHAVIVPIRAGGGTRIKILEAFSYERPVVTTTLGVEGIEAQSGKELLIGDTPEEFAACCVALMRDPRLSASLVENAHSLLRRAYSVEALKQALACPATNAVLPESRSDAL
jgi:glycosyltransferase involved in cell wall biosynthesis